MQNSDRELSALFVEHREALYRYVARYTGDADLADDVVQDTFVRLHERPPADRSAIRGWLFRVATNLARDSLKIEGRRRELVLVAGDAVPHPVTARDPAQEIEQTDLRTRVRAAIDALSERERTVLLMYQEGFLHREIAEAVGTTTKSIGTMIVRAIDKVAQAIGTESKR